tara:strand:+ start:954 stop:1139 length:186 start_codon:yes stop_codon:yes gene_type:complete
MKRNESKPTTNSGCSQGLAKSVGQACDLWLEKRGIKSLGWKARALNRPRQDQAEQTKKKKK